TRDDDANGKIESMIGKACQRGVEPFHDGGFTPDSGLCMDDLAGWMAGDPNDEAHSADLRPSIPNKQHAQTYMIGFGDDVGTSKAYLDQIAAAGGTGHSYAADNAGALTTALENIFKDLQEDSATFVTPSI